MALYMAINSEDSSEHSAACYTPKQAAAEFITEFEHVDVDDIEIWKMTGYKVSRGEIVIEGKEDDVER